jgi:hypothetical protein
MDVNTYAAVTMLPSSTSDLQPHCTPSVDSEFPTFANHIQITHPDLWQAVKLPPSLLGLHSLEPYARKVQASWMHYCYIDILWWDWQQSPQGTAMNPNLTGAVAIMDPWANIETVDKPGRK